MGQRRWPARGVCGVVERVDALADTGKQRQQLGLGRRRPRPHGRRFRRQLGPAVLYPRVYEVLQRAMLQ